MTQSKEMFVQLRTNPIALCDIPCGTLYKEAAFSISKEQHKSYFYDMLFIKSIFI